MKRFFPFWREGVQLYGTPPKGAGFNAEGLDQEKVKAAGADC